MCERTNCFSSEDYFQRPAEFSRVCVCVCGCFSVSLVCSRRRRLVVVRGAVRCVGGTFWSVGGKPAGGDCMTVARRRAADSSWQFGHTSFYPGFTSLPSQSSSSSFHSLFTRASGLTGSTKTRLLSFSRFVCRC